MFNREIINEYEYDIYIKDINLLIEYDGLYYHRILNDKSEKEIEKENNANKLGYDFIRIVENQESKKITMNGNIIQYKYMNKTKDLNIIISLLIEYINKKYNLNLTKAIPKNTEEKALLNTRNEQYENSIEVTHPEIAKLWDYRKNGELKPSHFSYGSNQEVWWICPEGHSYKKTIKYMVRKSNCTICKVNSILIPYIIKEGAILNAI